MARLSRLIVLVSTLAAGGALAFFVGQTEPAVPWIAGAAFVLSFALARVAPVLALLPALLLAFVAPAVVLVSVGADQHHDVIVWLALLAGPVLAAGDWSRWHTPPAWTPWLTGWALVLAATWPIIAGREIDFSLVAARTFDTPNGLAAGLPSDAAAAATGTALGQLLGILWLDFLWSRFGSERVGRAERWVCVPLIGSAALASLAGLYQRYVDGAWLGAAPWPELGRSGSLMLDANSFGMAAAIWAPFAILVVARIGRPQWIGAFVTLLLAAGVWTSGSRTAFVTVAAGLGAAVIVILRTARGWQGRLAPVAIVVAGMLVLAAVSFRGGDRANPVTRLLQGASPVGSGGMAGLVRTLWTRDGYGTASMRAIAEHPLTGVGIGAFNHLSTDYAYLATGAVLSPDNAQNWWRQQIAELGFAGASWSVGFSIVILLSLARRVTSPGRHAIGAALRTILVVLGLVSLVGVATQHPALWITFVTLLYWLGAMTGAAQAAPAPTQPRGFWVAAVLVASAVAGGQWWSARHDLRVPVRAARIGFPYAYGFTAPDGDGVPWADRRAVVVMRSEHAYFSLTGELPHHVAPVRVRLWRGGALIADVEAAPAQSFTRFIRVPEGQQFMMLESRLSATAPNGRGMKVTGRWEREIPPGTPPEMVIP